MKFAKTGRGLAAALFTATALAAGGIALPIVAASLNPALAQEQVDFHAALEPFGMWQRDPRWGEIWVPFNKARGWRPYTVGHWVYTEEWGWYWISDDDEQDWGWITYHYGRWVFLRGLGWSWVPGEEWAPAWVNWRASTSYVGWAPLPPDDVYEEYDDTYDYWTFLPPRYLASTRPRQFYLASGRDRILATTVITNRTVPLGGGRGRFAVNPGVSPARIAAASGAALATFTVRPRVLSGTQGVAGAVTVPRGELGRRGSAASGGRDRRGRPAAAAANVNAVAVQKASATVAPAAASAPPPALGKGERGRMGTHPPRAAQGQSVAPAPTPAAPGAAPASPSSPAPAAAPATPPPASAPAAAPPRTPPSSPPPPAPSGAPRPPGASPPPPPASPAGAPRPTPPPPGAPPSAAPPNAPPRPGAPPQARPERPATPQTPPPSAAPPAAPKPPAPPPPRCSQGRHRRRRHPQRLRDRRRRHRHLQRLRDRRRLRLRLHRHLRPSAAAATACGQTTGRRRRPSPRRSLARSRRSSGAGIHTPQKKTGGR